MLMLSVTELDDQDINVLIKIGLSNGLWIGKQLE